MWYEFHEKIPENAMRDVFLAFVIPDTVRLIGEKAFASCRSLEKVFIPKSVEIIEENAFQGCGALEIYCEDAPKAGWVDETRRETERYEITTPEDDAFNFHRSGGSFTSTWVEREVERRHCWNPDHRPVHPHTEKAVTASWERVPRKVLIFCDMREADSLLFKRVVKDLMRERKELSALPLIWQEEGRDGWLQEVYPHSAVPALFYGSEKLYESVHSVGYAQLKAVLGEIFGALAANR